MQRELYVHKEDDRVLFVCHHFKGPYEGRALGKRLGLEEMDPPAEDAGASPPPPGCFYMVNAMGYHPRLHGCLTPEQLPALAGIAKGFGMHVREGAELLPTFQPRPQTDGTHHSYVEEFETLHESVWHRGPKAVVRAGFVRVLAVALVAAAAALALQHLGDHYQVVSVDEAFARAERPAHEPGFLMRLMAPDHSDKVRFTLRDVRLLDGHRMILADGNFLVLRGGTPWRPMLSAARAAGVTPILDARISEGRLIVQKLVAGKKTFALGRELVRVARLTPTTQPPRRSSTSQEGAFLELGTLTYDARGGGSALVGERVCLKGRVVREGETILLLQRDGSTVVLKSPQEAQQVRDFLASVAGMPMEIQVDLVVEEIFPPATSGGRVASSGDRRVGLATVRSASAQRYHVRGRT